MAKSRGSWITNRVANPVLRLVLRTPLGRRLGRSLAVLRYTGTRTGQPHELVCQYVRHGNTVWVLVGHAERKTWWHNLRTPARVVATLAGLAVGRQRVGGRLGRYLRHDELGAELLRAAGSDSLTVTWAREHHLPPARWTVAARVGTALKAADDD